MTAMEKHHLITHVGTHGEWSQINPVIHVSSPTSTMVNIGIYWGCLHPPPKKKKHCYSSPSQWLYPMIYPVRYPIFAPILVRSIPMVEHVQLDPLGLLVAAISQCRTKNPLRQPNWT